MKRRKFIKTLFGGIVGSFLAPRVIKEKPFTAKDKVFEANFRRKEPISGLGTMPIKSEGEAFFYEPHNNKASDLSYETFWKAIKDIETS